ncbi:MAG: ribonuclease P protein component [Pseudomonadota bacterium]
MAEFNIQVEHNPLEIVTLRKRRDFLALRNGLRVSNPVMTVQMLKQWYGDKEPLCRVGYTVTTKVGNAVERNRIKRRLRAAVREVFPDNAKSGFDYCLIARRPLLTKAYSQIVLQLKQALDRLHAKEAKGSPKADS